MARATKHTYNMGNFAQKAGETDLQYYRRLAKQADQRLVRLEGYQHDRNFANVTQWAYARAQEDISKWSGPDARRFNTTPPMKKSGGEPVIDEVRLRSKIKDIKAFLESPTSTKKGITQVYKNRVDTINQKYGTSFTWQEFAKFTESETFNKLDLEYGSKTVMKAIGIVQSKLQNAEDFIEHMKFMQENHIKLSDDQEADEIIYGWMQDEGFNWDDLK